MKTKNRLFQYVLKFQWMDRTPKNSKLFWLSHCIGAIGTSWFIFVPFRMNSIDMFDFGAVINSIQLWVATIWSEFSLLFSSLSFRRKFVFHKNIGQFTFEWSENTFHVWLVFFMCVLLIILSLFRTSCDICRKILAKILEKTLICVPFKLLSAQR